MLEPRDRTLLLEALRPPEGFRFDEGIGTTYTVDLLALLMAPLAFTMFSQSDEDNRTAINSLEILESLRRHADRLTVFCHAGRIAPPPTSYPQLAFIERSVVECQPIEGGAFHPKVWILRWENGTGEVRHRVLCLSRNLTFSRAWDSLLALDGVHDPDRPSTVSRNRGLVDFVRALPRFVTRTPLDSGIAARVERLATELGRTEFEAPAGFDNFRFWPLGLGGRNTDPLKELGDRLLVISPFITLGQLEALAKGRRQVSLVSTTTALGGLTRTPAGISSFYTLTDRAVLEGNPDGDAQSDSPAEALELSDLHAKLYVTERGRDAHVWTGSANATEAAFSGNVEFLVELIGPRKLFGIDGLMEPQKGEIRFVNLLEDAAGAVAMEPTNAELEDLERRIDDLRAVIAGSAMTATVRDALSGAYDLEIGNSGATALAVPSNLQVRCWPVTLPSTVGSAVTTVNAGETVATFRGTSLQALTSFFTFEVTGRSSGEQRQVRFAVNLPLLGAPEGRRERVLRDAVSDRARMMRFLLLLLADEGIEIPPDAGPGSEQDRESAATRLLEGGLFEMLLRNLDRFPERLDNIDGLLKELRIAADGTDLLPEHFDAVWQPIWRRRQARVAPRTA